jgi:hypothetical protein
LNSLVLSLLCCGTNWLLLLYLAGVLLVCHRSYGWNCGASSAVVAHTCSVFCFCFCFFLRFLSLPLRSDLVKKLREVTPLDFDGPVAPRELVLTALNFLSHPPLLPGSLWKEDRNRIHRERRFARRQRNVGGGSADASPAWRLVTQEVNRDGTDCWRWCGRSSCVFFWERVKQHVSE